MKPVLPLSTTTDPAVRNPVVAVLPVGSFEQHGPQLPLATDSLVAVAITTAIAAKFEVLALPPVTFSCSHEHASFAGTVSLSASTLAAIVGDVVESLAQSGLAGLLVVNGHGGNYVLANVVQEANISGRLRVGLYPARQDWSEARTAAGMVTDSHTDMHAGELETSILLAEFPSYVRPGWADDDHTCDDRRHMPTLGLGAYSASGVIGRPSLASEAKGWAALSALGEGAGVILKILSQVPSDEP